MCVTRVKDRTHFGVMDYHESWLVMWGKWRDAFETHTWKYLYKLVLCMLASDITGVILEIVTHELSMDDLNNIIQSCFHSWPNSCRTVLLYLSVVNGFSPLLSDSATSEFIMRHQLKSVAELEKVWPERSIDMSILLSGSGNLWCDSIQSLSSHVSRFCYLK